MAGITPLSTVRKQMEPAAKGANSILVSGLRPLSGFRFRDGRARLGCFGCDDESDRSHILFVRKILRFDLNLSRLFTCLHDDLRKPIEERPLGSLVAFLAVGIAVAHADEGAGAGDGKTDELTCCGNRAAVLVESLDSDDGEVLAVGIDLGAIRA